MNTSDNPGIEERIAAIIARGRRIPRAPDVVRARLLGRARAAAAVAPPARAGAVVYPPPRRWLRVAVIGAMLLMFAAAGAAAGLYVTSSDPPAPEADPPERPRVAAPVHATPTRAPGPPALARPAISRARPLTSPQESYAAELRLLQRAQSDYAARNFPEALALVAEHARRFPRGRLAEEREALRVRALLGAGHDHDARRALGAFARHFPHSVLLPRLQEAARVAEP